VFLCYGVAIMRGVKKRWWLVVLIFAFALVVGWKENRYQTQAYECRAKYAEELSPWLAVDQQASAQQAIAAACEPHSYFYSLFGAANLPTMLLVIIGAGGIWAALRTLGAIEKQADESAMSVEQAKKNLQLLINIERAWIDLEIRSSGGIATLSIHNLGKSFAKIIYYRLSYASFPAGTMDIPPRASKAFGTTEIVGSIMSANRQNVFVENFTIGDHVSADDRSGKTVAVFWVRLDYLDTLRDEVLPDAKASSTEVYYRYEPSTGNLDFLPDYNKYA